MTRHSVVTFNRLAMIAAAVAVLAMSAKVAGAGVGAGAGADQAKAYAIRLHRPTKVGERYLLKLNWSRTEENLTSITQGRIQRRPVVEQRDASVDLAASAEVLATNARGAATRMRLVVGDRGVIGLSDGGSVRLKRGDRLVCSWTGKRYEVSCDNRQVSRVALGVLAQALAPRKVDGGSIGDDEVFGTPKRQSVGATWEVNRKRAAQDARRWGVEAPEGKIRGDARLVGLVKFDGRPCFKVEANVGCDGVGALPAARVGVPPNLSVTEGSFNAASVFVCPLDLTRRVSAQEETYRVMLTMEGQSGTGSDLVRVVRVIRGNRKIEQTELPAQPVAETK